MRLVPKLSSIFPCMISCSSPAVPGRLVSAYMKAPAAQPASTSAARYAAITFLFLSSKNMYAAIGAAIRQINAIASRPAVTFMTASSTSESAAAVRHIIPTGSVPLPSTELPKSSHSFPASLPFRFPLFSLMHISAFTAPKIR